MRQCSYVLRNENGHVLRETSHMAAAIATLRNPAKSARHL
jgi:hypothetical protein